MRKAFISVFIIALLATVLFFLNGGFGAGHGPYDRALGILALPWILLPWPSFMLKHDFVWLVLVPLVLNLLVVLVVGKFLLAHASSKS
jgi:hypothetical protein